MAKRVTKKKTTTTKRKRTTTSRLTKTALKRSRNAKTKLGEYVVDNVTTITQHKKMGPGYYEVSYKEPWGGGENTWLVAYKAKNPRHADFDVLG